MRKEKNVRKERARKIGIKWKMFAILLAFTLAVVAVIWTFQVVLLNLFYQNTKFAELELTAAKLTISAHDEGMLESTAYECAESYYSYIVIYKIEGGVARTMFEAGSRANSIMSFFSKYDLQMLYDQAILNGGEYVATAFRAPYASNVQSEPVVFEEFNGSPFLAQRRSVGTAVNANIIVTNGNRYFVIQTAELFPINAVVKTLNRQFITIGIILVFMALVLTGLMSRLITKPIVIVNNAARELAHGKYDTEFRGTGYREIYELSDTLNFAATELEKTDKLQKELISNVSHDLRTPLTMIKGYSEVMRDIPGENTPENVQVIIDETERLAGLVNDMLDVSSLQVGMREPNFEIFSLTSAVKSTLARYEKLTMQDGYDIRFICDGEAYVEADSIMTLQVVYNLVNNAINYTGDDKTVIVEQSIIDNKVRISVTDTGKGIEKDDIPLIWERYYKVDKTHKRATVGTGLGLSIVKEILALHGASFGVTSTIGKGSTFWFELDTISDFGED